MITHNHRQPKSRQTLMIILGLVLTVVGIAAVPSLAGKSGDKSDTCSNGWPNERTVVSDPVTVAYEYLLTPSGLVPAQGGSVTACYSDTRSDGPYPSNLAGGYCNATWSLNGRAGVSCLSDDHAWLQLAPVADVWVPQSNDTDPNTTGGYVSPRVIASPPGNPAGTTTTAGVQVAHGDVPTVTSDTTPLCYGSTCTATPSPSLTVGKDKATSTVTVTAAGTSKSVDVACVSTKTGNC